MNNPEIFTKLNYHITTTPNNCSNCFFFSITKNWLDPNVRFLNCTQMTALGATVGPEPTGLCDKYQSVNKKVED